MLNFRFDTGTVFHWPEARRIRTPSATARVNKRDHKWQQLASRKPECRQRRLRCSRRKPCTSCHGYDCTFTRHCLSRFHSFCGLIVRGQVASKHQHSWYALMTVVGNLAIYRCYVFEWPNSSANVMFKVTDRSKLPSITAQLESGMYKLNRFQ